MMRGESRENMSRSLSGKFLQGRAESEGAAAGGLCDPVIVL